MVLAPPALWEGERWEVRCVGLKTGRGVLCGSDRGRLVAWRFDRRTRRSFVQAVLGETPGVDLAVGELGYQGEALSPWLSFLHKGQVLLGRPNSCHSVHKDDESDTTYHKGGNCLGEQYQDVSDCSYDKAKSRHGFSPSQRSCPNRGRICTGLLLSLCTP